jgi:iron complex outermembrane receptor protein
MKQRNLVVACTIALFSAFPLYAYAQNDAAADVAPGPQAAPQVKQLEAVTVTAQKRKENLREVPVAVTVVTSEVLANANTSNTASLIQMVPSLTFRQGTTNLNSSLNIRGIGTLSFSPGSAPSVSTVVDGVVYAESGMAFTDLLDPARVEVLRGPQGTLFGINASGGVLNIVTTDPTGTEQGYVEGGVYNNNQFRTRGMISGPLSSTLDGQLSYEYAKFDGNARNYFNGDRTNGFQHGGIRGKLLWKPSDNVTGTFILDYSRANDNCCGDAIHIVQNTVANSAVRAPSLAPVNPSATNININNDTLPLTQDTNYGVSAQFDWKLPNNLTVTSISAFRDWFNLQRRDGDFMPNAPAYVNASVPGGNTKLADTGTIALKQYSQELRLASPEDQAFKYVLGAFLFHADIHDFFQRKDDRCDASTLPPLASGVIPCDATSIYSSAIGVEHDKVTRDNYALFGQGTYSFTDGFRGILGARYSFDKLSYSLARVSSATGYAGIGGNFANSDSTTEGKVSGKVGLQYDLTADNMAYLTYSQGYKGPAYNVFFNMSANNTARLAPETSDNYEVGLKSDLFDKHLELNLAAFYSKYNGFQTNSFVLVNGVIITNLINAGTVSTRGVEADFRARPAAGLMLSGGVTYTDAKIDKFNCPIGAPLTCQYPNGKPLPYAPKYKAVVNASYELQTSLPFAVSLNTNYSWQSSQQMDIGESPYTVQPAYGLWNAGIKFSNNSDTYSVSLVLQNILNKFYATALVPDSATGVVNGVVVPTTTFVRIQTAEDSRRVVGIVGRINF